MGRSDLSLKLLPMHIGDGCFHGRRTGEQDLIEPWYQDKANRVDILLKEESDKIVVKHFVNGVIVAKGKALVELVPDVTYHIKVGYSGGSFHLEVDGNAVLTLPDAHVPSGNLWLKVKNTTGTFQDVTIY